MRPSSKRPKVKELQRTDTIRYSYKDEAQDGEERLKPLSSFVSPLLTDMYQITMAYSLWKNGRHMQKAVFDLYFRKNPFGGEFTIFAGLEEAIRYISDFRFREDQIEQLQGILGAHIDPKFYEWLQEVNCDDISVYALEEGSVCFPRIPLLRIEGPLGIVQMLETTLLCLINYASLIATNAVRHRIAVGKDKQLLEFGLRRAQGPDGAMSASRYAYLGLCDGTSNVLASAIFGIPIRGTHAHSYITSFLGPQDLKERSLVYKSGDKTCEDFWQLVLECKKELNINETNESELVAFCAYARTFPNGFTALVDTYDTLTSGVPNFIIVALALHKLGYKAVGIRLDSGDLGYLSKEARSSFFGVAGKIPNAEYFRNFSIVASNDLNEATIVALNRQGHEIDVFAVGTNLVTCQAQPALGCVFKLVELDGKPRIKLSNEVNKVTLPGKKIPYRLFSAQGHPLVDLLVLDTPGEVPEVGKRILCLHPFEEQKRCYVVPAKVEPIHRLFWKDGKIQVKLPSLEESRRLCLGQISIMREDHMRYLNPTPYKVSVSQSLYNLVHDLWLQEAPIRDLV
eukprot:TRINITY_DN7258_c0_g1_i2.p1 TRINITY_DN7258_c0_g1~~TRINITY_DN7258_c0_g1_i2.p1  ORF type:complete len:569 (-),score=101.52 TRINITY_DN7258_c0_g1_i2:106-1812(-)